MLQILQDTIRQLGHFDDEELRMIDNHLSQQKLKTGDTLLKPGETSSALHFVVDGAFFQYKRNEELDKVIDGLFVSGDPMVEPESFTSRKGTFYTVEAFMDSTVYSLNINDLHHLIETSQKFFQLGKALNQVSQTPDLRMPPQERYETLIATKPELIKIFPLKYIASFLRITPETLSRIRKNISRE